MIYNMLFKCKYKYIIFEFKTSDYENNNIKLKI